MTYTQLKDEKIQMSQTSGHREALRWRAELTICLEAMILWVKGEKTTTDDFEGMVVGTECMRAANYTKKRRQRATRFWTKSIENGDMAQRRCCVSANYNHLVLNCKKCQGKI